MNESLKSLLRGNAISLTDDTKKNKDIVFETLCGKYPEHLKNITREMMNCDMDIYEEIVNNSGYVSPELFLRIAEYDNKHLAMFTAGYDHIFVTTVCPNGKVYLGGAINYKNADIYAAVFNKIIDIYNKYKYGFDRSMQVNNMIDSLYKYSDKLQYKLPASSLKAAAELSYDISGKLRGFNGIESLAKLSKVFTYEALREHIFKGRDLPLIDSRQHGNIPLIKLKLSENRSIAENVKLVCVNNSKFCVKILNEIPDNELHNYFRIIIYEYYSCDEPIDYDTYHDTFLRMKLNEHPESFACVFPYMDYDSCAKYFDITKLDNYIHYFIQHYNRYLCLSANEFAKRTGKRHYNLYNMLMKLASLRKYDLDEEVTINCCTADLSGQYADIAPFKPYRITERLESTSTLPKRMEPRYRYTNYNLYSLFCPELTLNEQQDIDNGKRVKQKQKQHGENLLPLLCPELTLNEQQVKDVRQNDENLLSLVRPYFTLNRE